MLSEEKYKKHWQYATIMEGKFREWGEFDGVKVFRVEINAGYGVLGVFIFYKTDKELNIYRENGVIEKAKQNFIRILGDLGYFEEFDDEVGFIFDSHENVKKNFKGNYYYRLLDG